MCSRVAGEATLLGKAVHLSKSSGMIHTGALVSMQWELRVHTHMVAGGWLSEAGAAWGAGLLVPATRGWPDAAA